MLYIIHHHLVYRDSDNLSMRLSHHILCLMGAVYLQYNHHHRLLVTVCDVLIF